MTRPRSILVTGASSGIGAALAAAYAAPDVFLFLHGRHANRLVNVAQTARRREAVVREHRGDVMDASELATWIKACDAECPLDLVIANAGVSAESGGRRETAEQARTLFDVNLYGVLNTVHPAVDVMKVRRHGQIAIMSSLASFRGFARSPAYCASKAAVRLYGEGLRADLVKHGIRVNVICPGFIATPMTDVNPFPMPFLMSAEQAARHIVKGLQRNQARIAFPWPMYWATRLLTALPQSLLDRLMAINANPDTANPDKV